eukprot:387954-Lingulodinium_polyedra.AAC.1
MFYAAAVWYLLTIGQERANAQGAKRSPGPNGSFAPPKACNKRRCKPPRFTQAGARPGPGFGP